MTRVLGTNKLEKFLKEWDKNTKEEHKKIKLFNTKLTSKWSTIQRQYFVKIFYHARGHFLDFLWLMGNTAPDMNNKKIILNNITEEFGGTGKSHERLYWDFAKGFGVDMDNEFLRENNYLPFIREFNKKHIEWLIGNDWESRMLTFMAYERLDNIDYEDLFQLAKSLGIKGNALQFFEVHREVMHFEMASKELKVFWQKNPRKVREAFNFIGDHQIWMWKNLSDAVFNFK